MAIPDEVTSSAREPDRDDGRFVLELSNNERVRARSVVIASGARYRRLAVESLGVIRGIKRALLGIASGSEAVRRAGGGTGGRRQFRRPGGGLSGEPGSQGLAHRARSETLRRACRATSSTASRGSPTSKVLTADHRHRPGRPRRRAEAVRWRRKGSDEEVRRPIQHLFLFIGAEPNTDWLYGSGIALDPKGFVLTGAEASEIATRWRQVASGVFAIGDVRSGSVKRVAAAVGEGAQVVAALHASLAAARPTAITNH